MWSSDTSLPPRNLHKKLNIKIIIHIIFYSYYNASINAIEIIFSIILLDEEKNFIATQRASSSDTSVDQWHYSEVGVARRSYVIGALVLPLVTI